MKHILFINGHLNSGGVERSLIDILKHFNYKKYAVDLLLLEDIGDYASELPSEVNLIYKDIHNTYGSFVNSVNTCFIKHDYLCLRLRILFLLRKFIGEKALRPAAEILLGKHHYDCAIAFRAGICSDLVAYSVNANRKITWWHHGEFNLDHSTYTRMCLRVDAVVAVSDSCCEMLRSEVPEVSDILLCIPNMVDYETILQKSGESPYLQNCLQIVSVGRLAPEKHFENAICVAALIVNSGIIDFEWHIVGDGSEFQKLDSLIKEKNLEKYVILEGNKPNPYPYMRYADLFVHPSYVESQGVTVLEAMSLGVPCVVTKSRGPCEFIEDGVNGLLAEQSPESLTEKVLEILKETFELETVDATCSQATCEAWDSMGQLNLVAELEDAFDVSLEPEEIGTMRSFDDVVRILKDKGIK